MVAQGLETVGKFNNYISMFVVSMLVLSNIALIFGTLASGSSRTLSTNFIVKENIKNKISGVYNYNGKDYPAIFQQTDVPITIYFEPSNPTNHSQFKTSSLVGSFIGTLCLLLCVLYFLNSCSNSAFCNQLMGARTVYKLIAH